MTDTESTPVADHVPETPKPEDAPDLHHEPETDDGLRTVVERLEAEVRGLSERVANLVPIPAESHHELDQAPVSRPWTHRGSIK